MICFWISWAVKAETMISFYLSMISDIFIDLIRIIKHLSYLIIKAHPQPFWTLKFLSCCHPYRKKLFGIWSQSPRNHGWVFCIPFCILRNFTFLSCTFTQSLLCLCINLPNPCEETCTKTNSTYFCSVQCFESWVNMPSRRKQAVSGNIFSCPNR